MKIENRDDFFKGVIFGKVTTWLLIIIMFLLR